MPASTAIVCARSCEPPSIALTAGFASVTFAARICCAKSSRRVCTSESLDEMTLAGLCDLFYRAIFQSKRDVP